MDTSIRILGVVAAAALMSTTALAVTPPFQQTDQIVARTQVSPLLAVDLNRQSIIDTLITSWQTRSEERRVGKEC